MTKKYSTPNAETKDVLDTMKSAMEEQENEAELEAISKFVEKLGTDRDYDAIEDRVERLEDALIVLVKEVNRFQKIMSTFIRLSG